MAEADKAQEIELFMWEVNNRSRGEVKRYAAGEDGYGPEFCDMDDCGAEMPSVRREWGMKLCIDCQARVERAGR